MMKHVCFALMLLVFAPSLLKAQADDKRLKEIQDAAKKDTTGWVIGGGLGLDFAQLAMINPRIGSGDNRIAFGGLGNIFANYKNGKTEWVSNISIQEAVQQLGGADWQKSLDVLRLNSKYSYQTNDARWAYAALLTFESLAMPTYPGNFLVKQEDTDGVLAQFLSPARFEFSPGINYKPEEHWNFFLSPASYKLIFVADQDIANLGIHGTQLVDENDPTLGYEKSFHQIGARFVAGYTNSFFNKRMTYSSRFDLFSNYLNNPQNMDVLWQNDLGWQLWKGLSLNFLLEAFYDHDILVQRKRVTETDPGELGREVSWTQALLVKYNFIF